MNQGNNPLYGGQKMAIGTWNAATTTLASGASASCTAGSIWLPDGALITDAFYFVQTTFTDDDAGDSQPVALGYTGSTGAFVASIAISDGTNPWDAGAHGTLLAPSTTLSEATPNTRTQLVAAVDRAQEMLHLTAPKELLLTLASERTIVVGKLSLYVSYVQTNDFA